MYVRVSLRDQNIKMICFKVPDLSARRASPFLYKNLSYPLRITEETMELFTVATAMLLLFTKNSRFLVIKSDKKVLLNMFDSIKVCSKA